MLTVKEDIKKLELSTISLLNGVKDKNSLDSIKIKTFGKKGWLTGFSRSIGKEPSELRSKYGELVNKSKEKLKNLFSLKEEIINGDKKFTSEVIDFTLPARGTYPGSLHPVRLVLEDAVNIFRNMGFYVAEGPEIEDEYHNFEALNIPKEHPSRGDVDTFYFSDGNLLRTHTSSVQIRELKNRGAPVKIITPGKVYRRDSDSTHTPMFHQLEGLFVDHGITFSNLKSVLQVFLCEFFKKNIEYRIRPSFFPFTEPSAEVDIRHTSCYGKGCNACKQSGWMEVLGCGMIHVNILKSFNINTDLFSGFAFGLGLDRLAMIRYEINDLRLLFENDIRFLEQFS